MIIDIVNALLKHKTKTEKDVKDVIKQEKEVLNQEKDVKKQEKDIP